MINITTNDQKTAYENLIDVCAFILSRTINKKPYNIDSDIELNKMQHSNLDIFNELKRKFTSFEHFKSTYGLREGREVTPMRRERADEPEVAGKR